MASGAELHFALHSEPKTQDPFLAADESATGLAYLTEGVLIRVNRKTQQLEPDLATSWKVENHGARIVFTLRQGVTFPGWHSVHFGRCRGDFSRAVRSHAALADRRHV